MTEGHLLSARGVPLYVGYMKLYIIHLSVDMTMMVAFVCTVFSSEVPHDLCPLSICFLSLPHSLHLNPVSGARLEGGQSVGGATVSRLIGIDAAILGGVGHSEGVALGVAS